MKYTNEILKIEINKKKVIWSNEKNFKNKSELNLNDFLEDNYELIQKDYLGIFDNFSTDLNVRFSDECYPFWWASGLLENTNFEGVKEFDDLIRALAIKRFIKKNNSKKIFLSGNHNEVILILEHSLRSENLNVTRSSKSNIFISKLLKFKFFSLSFFKGIVGIFYYSFIYFYRYKKNNLKKFEFDLIFLNYLNIEDYSNFESKFKGKEIWGDLKMDAFFDNKDILTVYLPLNENKSFKSNSSEYFFEENHNVLIYSLIGWDVFFLSLNDYFKSLFLFIKASNKIKERKIFDFLFKKFTEGFLNQKAARDIITYNLFNKLFKKIKCNELVLYSCENYALEVAFNSVIRRHMDVKICGYAHTVVRRWDLRYLRSSKFPKKLIPDKILVNREIDKRNLEEIDRTDSEKILIRSLRYSNLEKVSPYVYSSKERLNIILFLSYSNQKNDELIECFIKASKDLDYKFDLYIKFHPVKNYKISANLQYQRIEDLYTFLNNSIFKTICIINSYTSVGLECNHLNLPIIDKTDEERLPFSSLEETSTVKRVKDENEMQKYLKLFFNSDFRNPSSNKNSFNFEPIERTIRSIYE